MERRTRRALLALLLVGLVLMLGNVVAEADSASQGVDPYFNTYLGPVPEKPVGGTPGHEGADGDLLDWSGIDWEPWLDGLNATPWMALLAALVGLGYVFAERSGIPKRIWDGFLGQFNTGWDLARQTKVGWLFTEFLRRSGLTMVGAGMWVVKQVVAVPGMVKGFFNWAGRGTVENFNTLVAFFRADRQGKDKILVDLIDGARSNWEIAKALPGLFWEDVKTRWSRGWSGLLRMWTDPNVSNRELLQWGADHASMAADASVAAGAVVAVVRGVKAASWFRQLNALGRAREVAAMANAARLAGNSRVTSSSMLRVLRLAEEDVKFSELVVKLSAAEQDSVAFLLQKGAMELRGGSLRMSSSFVPSADLMAVPDVIPPVEARFQILVQGAPGYNLTPMSTVTKYPNIGRQGTFLTDARALEEIIGPIPSQATRVRILSAQARRLEFYLGLEPYSLERENVISIVQGISNRAPRRPTQGNRLFKGVGKGLPGGGPEVLVDSIPSTGGRGVWQIIVEVVD